MEVDKELKDCFQIVISKRQILNYHCFNNCVFQNFSSRLILVSMELTGHAQLDLCRGGAVILEGGVAQVAALISGCHLRDVQGPVRQQGQPLTARRGAQLRTATADYFPSIPGPDGRPRRHSAGGGTRKSHDVAGRDRQCQVAGTFGQKCGCDGPRDGESSNVRRLSALTCITWKTTRRQNSPVVHKHACRKDRVARIIVVVFPTGYIVLERGEQMASVPTCPTSPPVRAAQQP